MSPLPSKSPLSLIRMFSAFELVIPSLSVTVNTTLYNPGAEYVWVITGSLVVLIFPSPKSQV